MPAVVCVFTSALSQTGLEAGSSWCLRCMASWVSFGSCATDESCYVMRARVRAQTRVFGCKYVCGHALVVSSTSSLELWQARGVLWQGRGTCEWGTGVPTRMHFRLESASLKGSDALLSGSYMRFSLHKRLLLSCCTALHTQVLKLVSISCSLVPFSYERRPRVSIFNAGRLLICALV